MPHQAFLSRCAGNLRRVAAPLLALALLAACTTTGHKTVEAMKPPGAGTRIALMPLDVELTELSAAGVHEPKAEWTEAARRHLAAAFAAQQREIGLHLAAFDEAKVPVAMADHLNQVQKLHQAVGTSIMAHGYVPAFALPSKQGRFDWTLGPSVKALKEATGADYALFTHVRDSYTSAERVALIVAAAIFRVHVQGGQQVGFASLVDLNTGQVVWYNLLARASGDLRTAEAASETAKVLLAGFPK